MPQKIKVQQDGKEVEQEVFSAEEVTQREAAALDQWKKDHPDQTEAMKKMEGDLALAKAALEGGGDDKSQNFSALRATVTRLEKAISDGSAAAIAEATKIRTEMGETALQAAVRGLAGEDAELAKKVQFHFKETLKAVAGNSPEEFTKKIQQAYLLAAGQEARPDVMNGGIYGSGGAGPGGSAGGGQGGGRKLAPMKPEVIDMGKRFFGLSDEDIKKYDKGDFSTTK